MVSKARCVPPEIVLRVPGPWRSWQELATRLPDGCAIEGERLQLPGGPSMCFKTRPADSEFPEVFRRVCACPPLQEIDWSSIQNYRMNAVVVGRGGSRRAAQWILEGGAALVMAGGAGVFIDNCALAHGGNDWLELTQDKEVPQALFYAFVGLANIRGDIVSRGMQVFGRPDGILTHEGNLRHAMETLHALLKIVYSDGQTVRSGAIVRDDQGNTYRVRRERDGHHGRRLPDGHPLRNPYGCFRFKRQ